MKAGNKVPTSPSIGLPTVAIDHTTYFVNLALRLLRKAFDPHGHVDFDSVEAFQAAYGPHAEALMGDIPNYTDIQPTIQISEVKI